ncbi:MAG: CehA/McbA family metallohydrolase domain-containing protein [Planctomycetota bacterium]|jgi:hypothetical protein
MTIGSQRGINWSPVLGVTAGLCTVALGACAVVTPDHDAAAGGTRWWKGNTHTHTLWSDGDGAPELVADWYRRQGYQFLVLSDHNILSQGDVWFPVRERGPLTPQRLEALRETFGEDWVVQRATDDGTSMRLKTLPELRARFEQPGRFIFIQGEEISDSFDRKSVHVNGIHLAEVIAPQGGFSAVEVMQRNVDAVIDQGRRLGRPVLAHVNHPNFEWGLTPQDVAAVEGERFFEVYNGHPAIRNYGDETHFSTEAMWDIALTLRLVELNLGLLYGLATDDAHRYFSWGVGHNNPGRGWVMVRAGELSAEAIIEAMKRGDFYASSGVTLDGFSHDASRYTVTIEADPGLSYTTLFIGTRMAADGPGRVGEVLHRTTDNPAVYSFHGDELYVRAKVTSSRLHPNPYAEGDHECAWVQPVVPPRRSP